MQQTEIRIGRGHLIGVLLANAVLWVAAVVSVGHWMLGGPAAIALISIGSLLRSKQASPRPTGSRA